MGDAFTDQRKAERELNEFEGRLPDIEKMIRDTPFDKMTDDQHWDANAYYKYRHSELLSMLHSMADSQYMWEIKRHFDAALHQGKYAPAKKVKANV